MFSLGNSLETEDCHVISYDLSSVPSLAGCWDAPDTPSSSSLASEHGSQLGLELLGARRTSKMPPLLDAAEMHMQNYVKLRFVLQGSSTCRL